MNKISNRVYFSLIFIIIIFGIALCAFYGNKKEGYYIDEFYSITRANGTGIGIAVETGKWNDTSAFLEELVSTGEENYSFTQVYNNCGFHPPFYHYLLHFTSSVFAGVFSKWIGIGTNILVYVIFMLLSWYVIWRISDENKILTIYTLFILGISPCVISQVMFIRMYLTLGMFTMWYVYLHIRDLDRDKISVFGFLIPVCVCGFLGFMTMYYFVIIMFIMTFMYFFYMLVFCKKYLRALVYGIIATLSYVISYLYFPVCIYYLKHGKGKSVINNLVDVQSNSNRLSFFYNLVNEHVFGGIMPLFILMLLIGILLIVLKVKNGIAIKDLPLNVKYYILFGSSSIVYFLVMLKATTKAGDTTNRYCFCVYPIFIILMILGTYKILDRYKKIFSFPLLITMIIITFVTIMGYINGQVMYLYEDRKVLNDWIDNHNDIPLVMIENSGDYDAMIADFIKYDKVYFADCTDLTSLKNQEIIDSKQLLVYVDNNLDTDNKSIEYLLANNNNIKERELIYDTGRYLVYHLY